MEKKQGNRLDQIRARQKQLEKDYLKTQKEKQIFKSFPPIGRDIVSKIIMNQNRILVNLLNKKKNKKENQKENKKENEVESLEKYLKTSYCVPTLTKNRYQEETQS
jgi:hypothetical protein